MAEPTPVEIEMTELTPVSEISAAIAEYRKSFSVSAGQGLSMWLAIRAFGLDPTEAYGAVQVDGGNDHAIDLFWIDDENDRVVVMQSKSSQRGIAKAIPRELDELVNAHHYLQQPEDLRREGRYDLADSAEEYIDAMKRGFDLEFWYVVMGPETPEINRKVRVFNASSDARDSSRTARFVDLDLLSSYADAASDADRIGEAKIRVKRNLHYLQEGSFGKALIGTIEGHELAGLYRSHGDHLFDSNVRLFLGSRKGSVNAGIRDTLSDEVQRDNFWSFNNGITFVADSFQRRGDVVTLKGFSIINGCQTTVSIANAAEDGETLDGVSLLARIIVPDGAAVDDIIRFANSQNPIKAWSLRSRDLTQRRLASELASIDEPYFYSIRPGEKNTLTSAQRQKFGGRGAFREISADGVAQYLLALRGDPLHAYRDKGSLFRQLYRSVFPEDISAEEVLTAHVISLEVDAVVRERIAKARVDEDELALRILRKGGKIYVMAALGVIAERRNGAGYLGALRPDQITSNHGRRRLRAYATQAAIWYVSFVRPQLRNRELATLVRSPEFFLDLVTHLRDQYDSQSASRSWLDEALPRLGLT